MLTAAYPLKAGGKKVKIGANGKKGRYFNKDS
jgi:hypothetical protein